MENIIEMTNVSKCYKRKIKSVKSDKFIKNFFCNEYEIVEAIKDINISIKKGEVIGYVGINGAGKSTSIKILTGIIKPDNGYCSVLGMNSYSDKVQISKNVGVLFGQRSNLLWDLPLIHSYELLKAIYNISDNVYKESLILANKYLNIDELLNIPVRSMSLGQRMRSEFVAITLHQPKILFLDEPTLGLDIITKNNIKKMLKYLNEKKYITILLTSHDINDVESICDRLIVIEDGKIIKDDKIENILNNFKYEFVTIEFEQDIENKNFNYEGLEIISFNKNIYNCRVNLEINSTPNILKEIISEYSVKSFDITKPNLEELLVDLFQQKRGVKTI